MLIHLQGFSTAPNSPSVNSRSSSLGSSLSLGNISGMTANPEVKKRRAPPPPVVTPPLQNMEMSGQEKMAVQVTETTEISFFAECADYPQFICQSCSHSHIGWLASNCSRSSQHLPKLILANKIRKSVGFVHTLFSSLETSPSFSHYQEFFWMRKVMWSISIKKEEEEEVRIEKLVVLQGD